jgi:hypothetical protein
MKKLFTSSNLIGLCWTAAVFHVLISLIKYITETLYLDYIDLIIFSIVIVFAAAHYLYYKPKFKLGADLVMLLIMLAYFAISCVCMGFSSGRDYITENSTYMSDLEAAVLIFILGRYTARRGFTDLHKRSFHALLLLWSAFMVFVLGVILSNNMLHLYPRGHIGMYMGTHLELNCNRNETGAIAMVFMLLCFCMIFWTKKTALKAIYAVCCLVNYFILVLSNSRTALVAGVVGFSCLVGLVVFRYVRERLKLAPSVLLGVASAIAAGAAMSLLRTPVYQLYSGKVMGFGGIGMDTRTVFDPNDLTLSNRTVIWEIAVGLLFTVRPLLSGLTPIGIQESLGFIDQTHNEFLEVGCGLGIPALIAFLVFLTIVAVKCFKIIFLGRNQSLKLATILILAYLTANMAEARLMFYGWFIGYAFFFLCGYVNARDLDAPDCLGVQSD